MPDTIDIDEDMGNVRYIYTKKKTCHFIMNNYGEFILYAIEIYDGNVNGIEIGMSKRKILNYLGKPDEAIVTENRIMMEWDLGVHKVMAKFKVNKFLLFKKKELQELTIAKIID